MKKVIFSMCLAALAIGCAKTEVQFEQTDAISFAPVAQMSTKTAISGATFEETVPLYVFANAGYAVTDETTDVTTIPTHAPYLADATFTRTAGNVAYTGGYYWPNVKSLMFAGYINADGTKTMSEDFTTLTVEGYTQLDSGNNDFMYFFANNDGAGYTKQTPRITPVMKHACSWLVFNFIGDPITGKEGNAWVIDEVKVLNIAKKGTATLKADSAVWTEVWDDLNKDYSVYPTEHDKVTKTLIYDANTEKAIPVEVSNANNVIVIPQVPTNLYIKYHYTSQAGIAPTYEEKTLSLDYNSGAEWVAGKKYIYNVTVTATEIEIMPTAADWVTETTGNFNQTI